MGVLSLVERRFTLLVFLALGVVFFMAINWGGKDSQRINYLSNLVDEVHANLKKGKVREALELLEIHEAKVDHAAIQSEASEDSRGQSY